MQSLTNRQQEILELVAKGLTNEEIGVLIGRSTGTVRTHVSSILRALEVSNRTEAAACLRSAERTDTVEKLPPAVRATLVHSGFSADSLGDPETRARADLFAGEFVRVLSRQCWIPIVSAARDTTDPASGACPASIPSGMHFAVWGSVVVVEGQLRVRVQVDAAGSGEISWVDHCEFAQAAGAWLMDLHAHRLVARLLRRMTRLLSARCGNSCPPTLDEGQRGRAEIDAAPGNARASFARALEREPTRADAWCGLALSELACRAAVPGGARPSRAALEDVLRGCREHASGCAEHQLIEARLAVEEGNPDAAVEHFLAALEINPALAAALAGLSELRLLADDRESADALRAWADQLGHPTRAGLRPLELARTPDEHLIQSVRRALSKLDRARRGST